ncbi:MAG TPA: protein phosphatase CheZ [Steroidobacteraceae bacterium]|jgi:chemotaxis protein CheZ
MATPDPIPLAERYGPRVEALAAALARDDETGFLAVLDDIMSARKPVLIGELRDLTCNLQVALERFRLDARIADFAEKEMPDARLRLAHVLKLTDEAAHRTLDLIERSGPPAERTANSVQALGAPWKLFRERRIELKEFHELLKRMDAFLPTALTDAELIRRNLNEMLLAQAYQDLTGQIIRGVIELVREIEAALAELARLSGGEPGTSDPAPRSSHGEGPTVPGVTQGEIAAGQQDVDALLSGLGV